MRAILLWFDRLPYGAIGCCGNTEASTPAFDRLAAHGTTFDNCYATRLAEGECDIDLSSLVSRFEDDGIDCRVATCVDDDFDILLEQLDNVTPADDALTGLTIVSHPGIPAGIAFDDAEVATSVGVADRLLGRLMDWADPSLTGGETLLLVGAARGVPSPETGSQPDSDITLRDALIHVPLIAWFGDRQEYGVRDLQLVAVGDVTATLEDWLGIEFPVGQTSRSLRPVGIEQEEHPRDKIVIRGDGNQWAVRTTQWHLITHVDESLPTNQQKQAALESAALFVKPDDVWGVLDVKSQSPDVAESLVDQLLAMIGKRDEKTC